MSRYPWLPGLLMCLPTILCVIALTVFFLLTSEDALPIMILSWLEHVLPTLIAFGIFGGMVTALPGPTGNSATRNYPKGG